MKKIYDEPTIEVIAFTSEDILITSGGENETPDW